MVVVLKKRGEPGERRRRLRLLAVPAIALVLFAFGAFAQRQGWLGGVVETLSRWKATLTHPREVVRAALHGEALPEISISVKWAAKQKIEQKRDEALERGLLVSSGDDFVPATIGAEGGSHRAKIRLKGDILDHLVTRKWSFRIHLRGDARFQGMRRFSVQHPKTRFYLHEWGFLETVRAEGILAPRYSFARVTFYGQDKGIYAVEEAFARELMESHERREGLLIRLDENPFHAWFQAQPRDAGHGADVNPVSDRNVHIEPFESGRVEESPALTAQWARARGLLESFFRRADTSASDVFDAKLLGRYFAICELWGALHPLRWGNVRFYYNPVTDRIEPVAYDGSVSTPGGSGAPRLIALGGTREGLPGEPWTRRALRDPLVMEAYLSTLRRIVTREYVDALEARLGDRWRSLSTTLGGEFPGEPAIAEPWKRLRMRVGRLGGALRPHRHVLAFVTPARNEDTPTRLGVANVLSIPVRVIGAKVGDREVALEAVLPGALPDEAPTTVSFPLPGGSLEPVVVRTSIVGFREVVETAARPDVAAVGEGVPLAPTVEECLRDHPFLERRSGEKTLFVRAGTWSVDGDLVVPAGWTLEAGPDTTLRFENDAILVARGPVHLLGLEGHPVTLETDEGQEAACWGGIAVLDAEHVSVWEHARIRWTSGVRRGGWVTTSGTTFHRSPVRFRFCSFQHHVGLDDQLNVFRARLELQACEFGHCSGDALDGDFVEGIILDCAFHDVAGDAIDFSGTRGLRIEGTRLRRIEDKGVSVGEQSVVEVEGLDAEDVGIGVASKDLSRVSVTDSEIRRARIALAAYCKKPTFGPGTIDARGLRLPDIEKKDRTIVQRGSLILLNGERIEGTDLDVKRLYAEGILGK